MLRRLAVAALLLAAAHGTPCSTDDDCRPASCCHATVCLHKTETPDCSAAVCTSDCAPFTLDCGGRCRCDPASRECEGIVNHGNAKALGGGPAFRRKRKKYVYIKVKVRR